MTDTKPKTTFLAKELKPFLNEMEDTELFQLVHEGEFEVEGKWQHQQIIFREVGKEQLYGVTVSRSGSPYSDYYYQMDDWRDDEKIRVFPQDVGSLLLELSRDSKYNIKMRAMFTLLNDGDADMAMNVFRKFRAQAIPTEKETDVEAVLPNTD
jgi:hypothetical protein